MSEVVGQCRHKADAKAKSAVCAGRCTEGEGAQEADHFDPYGEMACSCVIAHTQSEVDNQTEVVVGVGKGEGDTRAEFGVDVELIEAHKVNGCAKLKEIIAVSSARLGITRNSGSKERKLKRKDIGDIVAEFDSSEGSDQAGLCAIFA